MPSPYDHGVVLSGGTIEASSFVDAESHTEVGGGGLPPSTGANTVLFDDGETQDWSDAPTLAALTLQSDQPFTDSDVLRSFTLRVDDDHDNRLVIGTPGIPGQTYYLEPAPPTEAGLGGGIRIIGGSGSGGGNVTLVAGDDTSAEGDSTPANVWLIGGYADHSDARGVVIVESPYLNFGTTAGETGYGLRDNAGTIEAKNEDGEWAALGGVTVPGDDTQVLFNDDGALGASDLLTYTEPGGLTLGYIEDLEPTAEATPSGGATTYTYKVIADFADGSHTGQQHQVTVSDGPDAGLDETHYVTISWTAIPGATGYRVFADSRGASPSTTGLLGTTTDTSFVDNGVAADGSSPYTQNNTGTLRVKYIGFEDPLYFVGDSEAGAFGSAAGINFQCGSLNDANGAAVAFQGGQSGAQGGGVNVTGGDGQGSGGSVSFSAGNGSAGDAPGGSIYFYPGSPSGSGLPGHIELQGNIVVPSDILTLGLPGAPTANQTIQPAASTAGAGASLSLRATSAAEGSGESDNGGDVLLRPGDSPSGQKGSVYFEWPDEANVMIVSYDGVTAFQPITAPAFHGDLIGATMRAPAVDGQALNFAAYDVDGDEFVYFVSLTNGNTPICQISQPSGTTLAIVLPTSDPHVAGALWNNSNAFAISAG